MDSKITTAPPQPAHEHEKSHEKSNVVRELIHEVQNHLHLAMMEVELRQMDSAGQIDCAKLLGILNSLKNSFGALRDSVLSSSAPLPRLNRVTSSNSVLAVAQERDK